MKTLPKPGKSQNPMTEDTSALRPATLAVAAGRPPHEPDQPLQAVSEMMGDAATALPDDSILRLVDPLSDGRHHAVLVTDGIGRLVGLVTQTDMIVALARLAVTGAARPRTS